MQPTETASAADCTEPQGGLVACMHCDLLQTETPLPSNGEAQCARCGARLYRAPCATLEHLLALVVGSLITFLIANLFPIVTLNAEGNFNSTTLTGCALALYQQGWPLVAGLMLVTAVIIPFFELWLLLYMLLPLYFGGVARRQPLAFRLVQVLHPWNMAEVFLLGVVVTIVKLQDVASVVVGVSLWAFAAFIPLAAAVAVRFEPRDLWRWVEQTQASRT